jgi:hypothetical protein
MSNTNEVHAVSSIRMWRITHLTQEGRGVTVDRNVTADAMDLSETLPVRRTLAADSKQNVPSSSVGRHWASRATCGNLGQN